VRLKRLNSLRSAQPTLYEMHDMGRISGDFLL
jgi:hypothetical protein